MDTVLRYVVNGVDYSSPIRILAPNSIDAINSNSFPHRDTPTKLSVVFIVLRLRAETGLHGIVEKITRRGFTAANALQLAHFFRNDHIEPFMRSITPLYALGERKIVPGYVPDATVCACIQPNCQKGQLSLTLARSNDRWGAGHHFLAVE